MKRWVVAYESIFRDGSEGTAIVRAETKEEAARIGRDRFPGRLVSVEWLPDRTRRLREAGRV